MDIYFVSYCDATGILGREDSVATTWNGILWPGETGTKVKMAARVFSCSSRMNQEYFKVFSQLNRRLFTTKISEKCAGDVKCSQLRKRGLLKVKGRDSVKFLQGLVTNDVESFHNDEERKTLYAMFLNASGRTLYDVVFYKHDNSGDVPAFFLECDSNAIPDLTKHLKMFKLRAKVDIFHAEDYQPWVMFSTSGAMDIKNASSSSDVSVFEQDPRLEQLGFRMVLPKGSSPCVCFEDVYETGDTYEYDVHRAKLGVCEGVDEIPPGSALPLEYNIAYLNGGIHLLIIFLILTTPSSPLPFQEGGKGGGGEVMFYRK